MKLFQVNYEVLFKNSGSRYKGKVLIPAEKLVEAQSLFLNAVGKSSGIMVEYKGHKLMLPLSNGNRLRVVSGEEFKVKSSESH